MREIAEDCYMSSEIHHTGPVDWCPSTKGAYSELAFQVAEFLCRFMMNTPELPVVTDPSFTIDPISLITSPVGNSRSKRN
jgi:hypothetical protein